MTSSPDPRDWTGWVREGLRRHEDARLTPEATARSRIGGRYALHKLLGEGATARVYLGWDEQLQRPVAVKILREAALLSQTARERFRREARTAGSLAHPNLVTVFDAGEDDGLLYLVMELVEGPSLADLLEGPRDQDARLAILEKVARGVAFAHGRGIVHRDLKPSNILLTEGREPKVADFGLAHLSDAPVSLTRTGFPVGTPLYMSPEQASGRPEEITPRSDVYALGAITYEALTGRPPFMGESESEVYRRLAHEEAVPPRSLNPTLSRDLETVILKALEKDPSRRYATAGELADELARCRGGEPVRARRPSIAARLVRRAARGWRVAAVGATVLLVVATARFWEARRVAREQEAALGAIREQARLSLEAALRLRRAGDLKGVRAFLAPLQAAYEKAVERAGPLAEADYRMGRMHRALMENAAALEFQDRALQADPAYAPALYERIVLLSRTWGSFVKIRGPGGELESVYSIRDDLRAAILRDSEVLAGVLRAGGPIGEGHLSVARGILALHRGDFAGAGRLFRDALEKDPYLEEAWQSLAQVQVNEKGATPPAEAYQEACGTLVRATAHDQGYLPYWEELSQYKAWEAVLRSNRGEDPLPAFAEAEAFAEKILALAPGQAAGFSWRGAVRFRRAAYLSRQARDPDPDFAGAERDFSEAVRMRPEWTEAHLGRVQTAVYRMIHRVRLRQDPSADARSAEACIASGRLAPADLHLWRGIVEVQWALYRSSRGEDPGRHLATAEEILSESLRAGPGMTSSWLWRGIVRHQKGLHRMSRGEDPLEDFEAAQKDFEERVRLSGAWPEVRVRRGLNRLAAGTFKAGAGRDPREDYAAAEADLTAAIESDPSHGEAWAGRGRLRLRQGQPGPAAADLERAVRVQPTLEPDVRADLEAARRP